MNLEKRRSSFIEFFSNSKYIPFLLFIGITALFIILLNPDWVTTLLVYNIGDVATKDVKAPIDFLVEDKEATQIVRKQAVEEILPVYDFDTNFASNSGKQVVKAFSELRSVFDIDKANKQQELTTTIENNEYPLSKPNISIPKLSAHDKIIQLKDYFEKILGVSVSNGAYNLLEKEEFSDELANLIINILTEILENGVVSNKEAFLKENEKGIILRDVNTKKENLILNLKRYYGLDQSKNMVRVIGNPWLKNLNYNIVNLIVDFVQRLIQPNIILNQSETEERKNNAKSEVKPVYYKIKKGEMLLREGERVGDIQLLKLKSLQSQMKNEQILSSNIGATVIFISLLLTVYFLHIKRQVSIKSDKNKNLIFIFSIMSMFLIIARLYLPISGSISAMFFSGIPIAASSMIICLFMDLRIAIPFTVVISSCIAILLGNRFEIFLFFLISGSLGAFWIQDCKERQIFIKTGLKLALLNIGLIVAIDIYIADFLSFKLFWDVGLSFMGGIGSGVITAGIVPLIEFAFDYTTDIKLLELANLDRPILKRLMLEAPGTYHHSVVVGSIVEAAASDVGANPLLAKVCGYYHDIGKLKQPLYFIENQSVSRNKHDKLAPSMSSLILISHVKNGAEIAKENKLGKLITDCIKQHHGTSLIKYFYEKAKQRKAEDTIINISDFRYPGPKPQTKEAGIVMLADVIEAASRTLDNPTPARIQGLVQNLINNIFSDGQLDDCELTLKDLNSIAKRFNKILTGIHHHRIEYDKSTSNNQKGKDANSDRQQSKQAQDSSGQNSEKNPSHLKRLGLS